MPVQMAAATAVETRPGAKAVFMGKPFCVRGQEQIAPALLDSPARSFVTGNAQGVILRLAPHHRVAQQSSKFDQHPSQCFPCGIRHPSPLLRSRRIRPPHGTAGVIVLDRSAHVRALAVALNGMALSVVCDVEREF